MVKKIALVHDYIKEYGGAERVLEALHKLYPDAPIYTLVYCPEFLGPHRERFKTWNIHSSFLQYIPYKHKFISVFRLVAPWVFKTFNFSAYDSIIVSATGAYIPNNITKQSAKQICYCHTPPRYLYGYATARDWKRHVVMKVLGEIANHFLRIIDYYASQNVDIFIANSENVARRIQKFYRRDSIVVYPPITNAKRKMQNAKLQVKNQKEYYIAGGRLARAKHYDVIIKACIELGTPLKIFGKGFAGYEEALRKMDSKGNVVFVGEVSDEEKLALMKGARAFIFAGEDEDFGIVPVEAMSMGTPVIAYKSGGVLETIVDGKTGVFFTELSVVSLVTALKRFQKLKIQSEDCIIQAKQFSESSFAKKIRDIVDSQ